MGACVHDYQLVVVELVVSFSVDTVCGACGRRLASPYAAHCFQSFSLPSACYPTLLGEGLHLESRESDRVRWDGGDLGSGWRCGDARSGLLLVVLVELGMRERVHHGVQVQVQRLVLLHRELCTSNSQP